MGTLIKKLTSHSAYLGSKTIKSEIYFFRVPKKGMSGMPYLRKPSLTFLDMHIKSKHFSLLFIPCQNFGQGTFDTQNCTVTVQKCRKIRGLGCMNQARTRARVTQPSSHIFVHICTLYHQNICKKVRMYQIH